MFAAAKVSVQAQLLPWKDGFADCPSVRLLAEELPSQYTLKTLSLSLTKSADPLFGDVENLVLLQQCLNYLENLKREVDDLKYARSLMCWVSIIMIPSGQLLVSDDIPTGQEEEAEMKLKRTIFVSQLGVKTISDILSILSTDNIDLDGEVLVSLLAFTDPRDIWTSAPVHKSALEILDKHSQELSLEKFIIDHILNGFIRPLFSKSKPATVTSQGRKAINSATNRHIDSDHSSKPWKYEQVSTVTIFKWVVEHADESTIHKRWHLFIPPLLTLLDDSSTTIRERGLQILTTLLFKTSSKTLKQTGLGEVFEDAVMPTLLFLPSLTPVEESIRLLNPAYSVLFVLGDARFPTKEEHQDHLKFMDRIMREGLLPGVEYCHDNVKIMEVLLQEMNALISRMGIHAVKHLKDVIPILSATLVDPFGTAQVKLLVFATKVLQTTILNCWPRMKEPVHRMEIVKALCLCWANVNEDIRHVEHNAELELVREELKLTATVLSKSVEGVVNFDHELAPLFEVDETLGGLFHLHARKLWSRVDVNEQREQGCSK